MARYWFKDHNVPGPDGPAEWQPCGNRAAVEFVQMLLDHADEAARDDPDLAWSVAVAFRLEEIPHTLYWAMPLRQQAGYWHHVLVDERGDNATYWSRGHQAFGHHWSRLRAMVDEAKRDGWDVRGHKNMW